jgi:hypothetical protein
MNRIRCQIGDPVPSPVILGAGEEERIAGKGVAADADYPTDILAAGNITQFGAQIDETTALAWICTIGLRGSDISAGNLIVDIVDEVAIAIGPEVVDVQSVADDFQLGLYCNLLLGNG